MDGSLKVLIFFLRDVRLKQKFYRWGGFKISGLAGRALCILYMYHMQLVCFVTYDMNGCLILINLVQTVPSTKSLLSSISRFTSIQKQNSLRKKIGEGAEKITGGRGQK